MTKYVKHENPYRKGTDACELFAHMQTSQVFTIKGLIEFCVNKLHLSPELAKYKVYIINSPRERSHNGSDARGNPAAKGHLHYSDKLERKWVGNMRQPQYFQLKWRKYPLQPKVREHVMIQLPEKIVKRTESKIRERV